MKQVHVEIMLLLMRGYSGSGKDYIGEILKNSYGYRQFAFADALKTYVASKYDCDRMLLYSQTGKQLVCKVDERLRTYRQILIDEAALLREKDSAVFVSACCQAIMKDTPPKVVITDWRYPDEERFIRDNLKHYAVYTVHVQRPGISTSPVNDATEYYLEGVACDYSILNTMDDGVYREIEKMLK